MEFPSVLHPKRFRTNGCMFEVVSYSRLTDIQAAAIVRQYLRIHKIKAKDRGKLVQIVTTFDRDSANLL